MNRRTATFELTPPGWCIAVSAGVLCAIGLATIYVADTHYYSGHDGPANARKQLLILVCSLLVGACVLRLGYRRLARWAYPLFIVCMLLLIPPVIAHKTHSTFGGLIPPINGAYRWIRLPFFQLQPSEVMKIGLILALAAYLRFRSSYRTWRGLILPLLVSFVPLALILLEPDLGTAMLIVPLVFVMFFVAGAKPSHLATLALIGLLAAPLAWTQLQTYQRRRITTVLLQFDAVRDAVRGNPERYAFLASPREAVEWTSNAGYQLVQSKNAIGSGGVTGNGWGDGPFLEHNLLPDGHNDFVFALVAHQWGFLGAALVIAAYGVILVAAFAVATATKEPFGRLIAVGVATLLAMQVVVNIGMTLGLTPVTGMTLPLVSYGGCSLLVNVVLLALLISVSQHRPFLLARTPFQFAPRARREHPLEKESSPPPSGRPAGAGAARAGVPVKPRDATALRV